LSIDFAREPFTEEKKDAVQDIANKGFDSFNAGVCHQHRFGSLYAAANCCTLAHCGTSATNGSATNGSATNGSAANRRACSTHRAASAAHGSNRRSRNQSRVGDGRWRTG